MRRSTTSFIPYVIIGISLFIAVLLISRLLEFPSGCSTAIDECGPGHTSPNTTQKRHSDVAYDISVPSSEQHRDARYQRTAVPFFGVPYLGLRGSCAPHGYVSYQNGEIAIGAEIDFLYIDIAGNPSWIETGTYSDSRGYYSLDEFEHCPEMLSATIVGSASGIETRPAGFERRISAERMSWDIIIEDASNIHGVVVDDAGAPVAGAEVCATREWIYNSSDPGDESFRGTHADRLKMLFLENENYTVTGPDGEFILSSMNFEPWILLVNADTYQSARVTVENGPGQDKTVTIDLQKDKGQEPWDIYIVDGQKHAIEGATVIVDNNFETCVPQYYVGTTNIDGLVAVDTVKQYAAHVITYASGFAAVETYNYSKSGDVEIMLEEGCAVRGTVRKAANNCPCYIQGPREYAVEIAPSSDGRFYQENVPCGISYFVFRSKSGLWVSDSQVTFHSGLVTNVGYVGSK